MINRKKGPDIIKIKKLFLPDTEIYSLPNGAQVCEVNLGSQEIIKFEIFHHAGRIKEDFHLASRAVSSLIKDGTTSKTSAQISEEIDYYGSSVKTASNMDFSYSTLFTLSKHCNRVLPLLQDMYYHPVFLEDEVQKFKQLNIQKLKEELTKNDVITYRQITEEIFGKNHPYGYNSTESDYQALSQEIIQNHYNQYLGSDNCYIFISGKINNEIRSLTSELFGSVEKASKHKEYNFTAPPVIGRKIGLKSKNEHQSAIKTGRHLFNKNHPDNPAFFLLNIIYGGYFGSRLMVNIREDKGYTYDISSSADQMLHDGCFYVSTEAAPEYVTPLLNDIYHQMEVLKQDKVKSNELSMVRNYLMGTFMNMLDGPLNISSMVKTMVLSGKKPQDFLVFCEELLSLTPQNIIETAQKYFIPEEMTEVLVSPHPVSG
ncbi:MAG: insulinase family protein [Saprospiraceae bacterium]|nr:insulinase family protein [Saprospiraceae bacterium]